MARRSRGRGRRQRSLGRRLRRHVASRLAVLATIAVAIVIAAKLVDLGAYRPRAESMASGALGMDVAVAGAMGIGLLPAPHVSLGDVRITGRGPTFARIGETRV